jgi:hypothetical protein
MAVYVEFNAMLACPNACEIAFMLTYFFRSPVSFVAPWKRSFHGATFGGLGSF